MKQNTETDTTKSVNKNAGNKLIVTKNDIDVNACDVKKDAQSTESCLKKRESLNDLVKTTEIIDQSNTCIQELINKKQQEILKDQNSLIVNKNTEQIKIDKMLKNTTHIDLGDMQINQNKKQGDNCNTSQTENDKHNTNMVQLNYNINHASERFNAHTCVNQANEIKSKKIDELQITSYQQKDDESYKLDELRIANNQQKEDESYKLDELQIANNQQKDDASYKLDELRIANNQQKEDESYKTDEIHYTNNRYKSDLSQNSNLQEDSAFPICKICFLFKNPIDGACDLIAPCGCKGSIKYVHKTCLRLWRFKGKNIREIKKCEQCCCDYKVAEDLMPYLLVVRTTTAVSIAVAILVARCVINTSGEALAFLVDEDNMTEDIIYNNGVAGFKQLKYDANSCEDMKGNYKKYKPKNNKYAYDKRANKKFDDVVAKMKQRSIDMQHMGYRYYEDGMTRLKRYLDNRVYKEKFALTLYSTFTLFLVTYAFMFCWSFWPVANFLFTMWRIYQFGFLIDKVLLFCFNCYYVRKLYQDLFVHIDSWYIFLLNYSA